MLRKVLHSLCFFFKRLFSVLVLFFFFFCVPPTTPFGFLFPLLSQCDRYLVVLVWGLMAGLQRLLAMVAFCSLGAGWSQWRPLVIQTATFHSAWCSCQYHQKALHPVPIFKTIIFYSSAQLFLYCEVPEKIPISKNRSPQHDFYCSQLQKFHFAM